MCGCCGCDKRVCLWLFFMCCVFYMMRFLFVFLFVCGLCCGVCAGDVLTLEGCYEAACGNFPLVKQYDLIDRTCDFTVANAGKGYLPQLSFSAQATYQSDVTKLPSNFWGIGFGLEKDQYKAVLELNQTIWDGGAVRSRKRAVRAEAEVDERRLDVDLYGLRSRVNGVFFGILLLDARLVRNDLLLAQLGRDRDMVVACLESGVATQADLDAVDVERLGALQSGDELRLSRKAYVDVLSLLTGLSISEDAVFEVPADPGDFIGDNMRPELSLFDARRRSVGVQAEGVDVGIMPKVGLFVQGAYSDPGLNMLKGGFEFYYVAGLQFKWNLGDFYTRRNDKRLLRINSMGIDVEEEVFRLNSRMESREYIRAVERFDALMKKDVEIMVLRKRIREAAEERVLSGTLTVTEMLREVMEEDQAGRQKLQHEIERLEALYDLRFVLNN